MFPTADGWIILAVGNDSQFQAACRLLELVDVAADPRFADNAGRISRREELKALIAPATRGWQRDALLAACAAANVPAGPINSVAQALADPQIAARGMVIAPQRPDGSTVPGLRTPIRFSDAALNDDRAAPLLGADDLASVAFLAQ